MSVLGWTMLGMKWKVALAPRGGCMVLSHLMVYHWVCGKFGILMLALNSSREAQLVIDSFHVVAQLVLPDDLLMQWVPFKHCQL